MNTDDPKFTAHTLGELDDLTPAERAEIAALLAADADAAADAEETRSLAARLRSELQSEQSAPLTDAQRAAVLAANAVPVSLRGSSDFEKASVRPWRPSRVLGSLALAASVVLCATMAWKAEFQKPVPSVENLAITPQSPAANQPAVEELAAPNPEATVTALNPAPVAKLPAPATTPISVASAVPPASKNAVLPKISESNALVAVDDAADAPLAAKMAAAPTPPPPTPADLLPDTAVLASRVAPEPGQSQRQEVERLATMGAKPAEQPASNAMTKMASSAAIPGTMGRRGGAARSMAKSERDYYFDAPDTPSKRPMRGDALAFDSMVKNKAMSERTRGFGNEPQPDPSGGETAESYDFIADNAFLTVAQAPLSTFSIDVDTASYAIVRRFLNEQHLPPKGAVRIEELITYFTYEYPQPEGDAPFSATMEVAACPWTPAHRLVRIGLKGREIAKDKRPASNLVFLIDVSGSMQPANKLPLLKQSLGLLIDQLGDEDQVAMVVYAGNSGCVLEPTRSKAKMRAALKKLESGGSTNGASGVQLAYEIAEKSFIKGGTNRVILATDGDWNVGITNPADLFDMITKKAKGGVFLTVLGFGMDNLKDSMLVKLADKGNGNYGYIDTLIEAKKLLADQLSSTLVTIAKDVKIQVEFNPAQVAAYRLIGYEKRLLAKEDFNDDTKDAGEIGAGHTVTALYEVVPAGGEVPRFAKTDELKYQRPSPAPEKSEIKNLKSEISPELLTLKLRYKAPDGDASKLLEFPLTDSGSKWENSSRDFRFAAAVAGYGMLLRDSPHKGTATWNSVRELAVEGKGEDATGYRAEFIALLEKARALSR